MWDNNIVPIVGKGPREPDLTLKIFFKLIGVLVFLLLVALVATDFLASRVAESYYIETRTRELADKCRLVALISNGDFEQMPSATVRKIVSAAGARLTVIGPDGRVLADTEGNPARMENHRSRPEVRTALSGDLGSGIRQSPTTSETYLYVAVPFREGVLRLAAPIVQLQSHVQAIRRQLLLSIALAFIPAVLLAALFARRVSAHLGSIIDYAGELAKGNFQARLPQGGTNELAILSLQLNETGEKLQKMFEQLQQERAKLEKLERIRKDFVINVSHELRTPLASIQGYTDTLLDGALHDPANNVRFLSIIRQNAERLTRLTADLLTLSRIELAMHKFSFASYRISTLLTDAMDSMRPLSDNKNIVLRLEAGLPETEVFCDAEAVHQILSNLVDNAVKYTSPGGSITVGAQRRDGKGSDFLEVYVRDTGTGIPTEDLPRLFERFYRVDKARSRELGGTGLGLAIVKHLVLAQGGEVRVESELHIGSAFYFTLPVEDLNLNEQGQVHTEFAVS